MGQYDLPGRTATGSGPRLVSIANGPRAYASSSGRGMAPPRPPRHCVNAGIGPETIDMTMQAGFSQRVSLGVLTRVLGRFQPDGFVLALIGTVTIATLLPCQRTSAV